MGQVPAFSSFLIVGNGRVARHFARYFFLESLPFLHWSRQTSNRAELRQSVEASSHALLLISDRAIPSFVTEHPYLREKICVHFSGALTLPEVPSAHPLMTFSDTLYDLESYRRIPFITERGRGRLSELLPGLNNPFYEIDARDKALYHALCVLSGNFTVLLWEKVFKEFSDRFDLPKGALIPYLRQVMENLASSPAGRSVLTGPLARGDRQVIASHLRQLENDPFKAVYEAFVAAHMHKEAAHEIRA